MSTEKPNQVYKPLAGDVESLRALNPFETLLEAVPDPTFFVDRSGKIVIVNSRVEEMFGYGRAELIGQDVEVLVPRSLRRRHVKLRRDYARKPESRAMGMGMELSALCRNGRTLPVEISLRPADDGIVVISVRDVSERRLAMEALRKSEGSLRRLLETVNVIPWEADAETWCFTYVGPQAAAILGYPLDDWYEKDFWVDHIHPEDRDYVVELCSAESLRSDAYEFEYQMLAADGRVVALRDIVSVERDADGRATLRGFMIDVTENRRNREVLRDLGGHLINAQEDERRRIARELHDDLSQGVALLAVRLDMIARDAKSSESVLAERISELSSRTDELSTRVYRIAHELHPANLEHLGLVASLGSLCKELEDQHGLSIEYVHDRVPGKIAADVALCLFRIAQEALRNVDKHSGVRRAHIELRGDNDAFRLRISDSGIGFDVESVRREGGLGLVSMRERLRLVGGQLAIDSGPTLGTSIEASVPLSPRTKRSAER